MHIDTFGFGLCKTGKYKLARVYHVLTPANNLLSEAQCQVYTLGQCWSAILSAGHVKYDARTEGAFLNGRLHWLVKRVKDDTPLISCFNLASKSFSTFSPPPIYGACKGHFCLSVLRKELCFTDNLREKDLVIWLRKEEGKEQNWTRAYVIEGKHFAGPDETLVWPIHVYQNGDMFLAVEVEHSVTD